MRMCLRFLVLHCLAHDDFVRLDLAIEQGPVEDDLLLALLSVPRKGLVSEGDHALQEHVTRK